MIDEFVEFLVSLYGKDYYVNDKHTQISFHKRTDANHYLHVPEFTIKIKPARKDYNEKGWFMCIYNKAEFEEAMKNAVKTIVVSKRYVTNLANCLFSSAVILCSLLNSF